MEESSENSVDMPEIPLNDELDRMVSLRENMLKEVQKEVVYEISHILHAILHEQVLTH